MTVALKPAKEVSDGSDQMWKELGTIEQFAKIFCSFKAWEANILFVSLYAECE